MLGGALDVAGADVYPARIADPTACDRFVLREVRGFDPAAPTPLWMRVRLARCGMRSVSLAVDVTNYLMLELGQPLHAFDRAKLTGEIVVRRAAAGETLETLDHVVRDAAPGRHPDHRRSPGRSPWPAPWAAWTPRSTTPPPTWSSRARTSRAEGTAKMSRRHRLHSEASYRFERGVDRELPLRATARAVALLAGLGGGAGRAGLHARRRPRWRR